MDSKLKQFIESIDNDLIKNGELVDSYHLVYMISNFEKIPVGIVNLKDFSEEYYKEPGFKRWEIIGISDLVPEIVFNESESCYFVLNHEYWLTHQKFTSEKVIQNFDDKCDHDLGYYVYDSVHDVSAFIQIIDETGVYAWLGDFDQHDKAYHSNFIEVSGINDDNDGMIDDLINVALEEAINEVINHYLLELKARKETIDEVEIFDIVLYFDKIPYQINGNVAGYFIGDKCSFCNDIVTKDHFNNPCSKILKEKEFVIVKQSEDSIDDLKAILSQLDDIKKRKINYNDSSSFENAVQSIIDELSTNLELELRYDLTWENGHGYYVTILESNVPQYQLLSEISEKFEVLIDANYYYLQYCRCCSNIDEAIVIKESEYLRDFYKSNVDYCKHCNQVFNNRGEITIVDINSENVNDYIEIIKKNKEIHEDILEIYEDLD